MEFIATCPRGFEGLLSDELAQLHVRKTRPLRGQVAFLGTLKDAYRVCLWSRLASRVLAVVERIDAADADALYQGVIGIDWSQHIAEGKTFAIDAHGTNDQLRNSQFVALRAKDAICDQFMERTGARPEVDTKHPDVVIAVRLSRTRATVAIDLAGTPLFRRGYDARTAKVAQLRPDYAAALLAGGGWADRVKDGAKEGADAPCLVSLWAGQGSVLVEAANICLDRAPGLLRSYWGFAGWAGHDARAWDDLLAEADDRAEAASGRALRLVAADSRADAAAAWRQSLRGAGLSVEVESCDFAAAAKAAGETSDPLVCADLSWLDEESLAAEAQCLADLSAFAPFELATLSKQTPLEGALGKEPVDQAEVFLGRDQGRLALFEPGDQGLLPTATVTVKGEEIAVLVPQTDQFAARLAKVAKLRAKWARKNDVTCYRVYDADLPDYAVSIELYEGSKTPGRWLQISEYAPPKGVDQDLAHRRLMDVLTVAPRVLDVAPSCVNLRVRTRARGGSQYADEGSAAAPQTTYQAVRGQRADMRNRHKPSLTDLPRGAHLVDEGGLTFEVNFSARLDCGIFLDHRDTRAQVREMMKDTFGSRRFLNLFAYTGTATCYAADGGAKYTTTVDLSNPSLEWARRNMARNGFTGPNHEFVQADVLSWVSEQRHSANRWDLIFCDVPTFSNSSRMSKSSWDVQRDHAELIIDVSRLLTRNGSAIFSCNLRGFKPDTEALSRAGVVLEDITKETIPEDFSRNAKIHHCYIVRRG